MTEHEDFEGLAAGYALHALEPEDEQRLAAHLLTCRSCAQLVADTAAVGAAFADFVTPEPAPPGLRARILAAAAAEPRIPSPTASESPVVRASLEKSAVASQQPRVTGPPAPRSRIRRMQLRSRIAVGVLAAAVGIGVAVPVTLAVSNGGTATTTNSALAKWLLEPDAREVSLHASGTSATAKAVMTSSGVFLVASGLPVNDRARSVYVLWAANANGTRSAVATFDVRNGSPVEFSASKLPFKSADIREVAVSYEPGRKAPTSPSDVVLSGMSV